MCNDDGEWAVLQLNTESLLLTEKPPRRVCSPGIDASIRSQVVISPCDNDRWLLMWGVEREVRINGIPQQLGLKLLDDRDEIRITGLAPFFYSTERLARIEPYPGSDRQIRCARSKLPIEKGTPAVRCPCCGLWHLMTEEHPAWTYGETCASCSYPTDLEAGFRWTPAEV
jgi:hypothetical protein